MPSSFHVVSSRIAGLGTGSSVSAAGFAGACRASVRATGRRSVEVCMVSTVDGWTEIDGRSSPLGGPEDQEMFLAWRGGADLVLVGAGTVRDEQYGAPSAPGLRIAVVTASADLDYSSPLFASGAGLVVTTRDAPEVPVDSVRAGSGEVDLAAALDETGARIIHVEGGPRLNASLLAADLVDAVNLSVSPVLVGTAGRSIVDGPSPPRGFALAALARGDEFVFARYERVRSA